MTEGTRRKIEARLSNTLPIDPQPPPQTSQFVRR
jgi:hypothetical protein